MIWHRTKSGDALLRLAGVVLICVAAWAAATLFGSRAARAPDYVTTREAASALVLFGAGCAGSALLLLGARLFDEVAVSARWAAMPGTTRRTAGTGGPPARAGSR